MWDVSPALAAAYAGPGVDRSVSWGELWQDGVKVATVELETGTVTFDGSAGIRGSVRVTIPSIDDLLPEIAQSGHNREYGEADYGTGIYGNYVRRFLRGKLVPLKTQLRVFTRALLPGTDTWETVPMGRFTVADPTFNDTPDGDSVTITGLDAASDVAAAKWAAPFVIAKGTNVETALRQLLQSRVPGLTVVAPSTNFTTPRMVFAPGYGRGGDPWQDATRLAASAGWVLYIDRVGRAVAEPPADPGAPGTSVWDLKDDGTAQRFALTPNAADIVNTVIVYAESAGDKPVVAVVRDMNGPYGVNAVGERAREHRSSAIRTLAQAQNAGIGLLRRWTTVSETVEVGSHPAPHLEPGDLVAVFSEVLELEDDLYRVQKVVIDLDHRAPTVVTVARRI